MATWKKIMDQLNVNNRHSVRVYVGSEFYEFSYEIGADVIQSIIWHQTITQEEQVVARPIHQRLSYAVAHLLILLWHKTLGV